MTDRLARFMGWEKNGDWWAVPYQDANGKNFINKMPCSDFDPYKKIEQAMMLLDNVDGDWILEQTTDRFGKKTFKLWLYLNSETPKEKFNDIIEGDSADTPQEAICKAMEEIINGKENSAENTG